MLSYMLQTFYTYNQQQLLRLALSETFMKTASFSIAVYDVLKCLSVTLTVTPLYKFPFAALMI